MPNPEPINYATPDITKDFRPNSAAAISLAAAIAFFPLYFLALSGFIPHDSENIVLCVLLTIPALALVLGIIALRRTRSGVVRRKGLAIAGTSLGIIAEFLILGTLLLPSGGHPRETANRIMCASNLKQIGLAMQLYANENKGLYPPRLEDLLLTQDMTAELFTCPTTNDTPAPGTTPQQQAANLSKGGHSSFIYLGNGKNSNTNAKVVLAYEPLSNHNNQGMNVLFADGYVEFLVGPMAKEVQAELQSGQNPPPSHR